MRERAVQRHDRLLALVRQRGSARVTDLADQLGVSPVTVRRDVEALAGKGLLDRVHGAVSWPRERGVRGRAPVGEGRVLGLLAPSATYYFADVIRGAHEAAARAGARLVLRISDYRPEEDPARAEGLLAAGAEGLLVAPGWRGPGDPVEHGGWVAELPVPVVLLERNVPPGGPLAGLDRVCSDHGHGVLLALRHLTEQGHGAPLLVARADSPTALAVREGYAAALRALDVPGPRPVIDSVPAETDPAGFERAVRELHAAVASGEATAPPGRRMLPRGRSRCRPRPVRGRLRERLRERLPGPRPKRRRSCPYGAHPCGAHPYRPRPYPPPYARQRAPRCPPQPYPPRHPPGHPPEPPLQPQPQAPAQEAPPAPAPPAPPRVASAATAPARRRAATSCRRPTCRRRKELQSPGARRARGRSRASPGPPGGAAAAGAGAAAGVRAGRTAGDRRPGAGPW
ncbi:hypothetical protein DMH15_27455 [Streptomyces sp. WAC 06725]|nr:hypothetical protein DMH15_27455 [Streptomyces sp. WAC 06725]